MTQETYNIWTMSISNWRLARAQNIHLLDITIKSGIEAFAPSWDSLLSYKAGNLSQEEYTRRYYDKVIGSSNKNTESWRLLTENKSVAFSCYCRVSQFCHRHLFAPLAITYLQDHGNEAIFHGELVAQFNIKC